MPGPVPNHSSDLSRSRDANRGDRPDLVKGERMKVTVPHADKDWHPVAQRLYKSLKSSGQSRFYQDSDWAYAYMLCDDITHYMSGRRGAQMAATIYGAMSSLLITEADRRRARIELDDPKEEVTPAGVTAIADYKAGLGA